MSIIGYKNTEHRTARNVTSLEFANRILRQGAKPDRLGDDESKKDRTPIGVLSFLEAPPGFGPGVEVLQTFALPLGHGAVFD